MRLDHLLSMENVPNAKANGVLTKRKQKRRRESEKLLFNFQRPMEKIVGPFNAQGPPVPIPNTEVKLRSAEDTLLETVRENRSGPTSVEESKRTP